MIKAKPSGIVSVACYLLVHFSGCSTTPLATKAGEPATTNSSRNRSAYCHSAGREKEAYAQNPEKARTYLLEPDARLLEPGNFSVLRCLSSPYTLDEYAKYAGIVHALSENSVLQTDFPLIVNDAVRESIRYFQNKEAFMRNSLGRSGMYLPGVKTTFEEYGLPQDLVYLAFIESGFNPHAYSRAGACGMWQFMKSTARRYGLQVDSWVDERRDPEKSTRAAAKYLKDLHAQFGDWYLAVTAYNAGERKVAAAIDMYKTADYWRLQKKSHLKLESRDFVPKLLAAIVIGKAPEKYGFHDVEFHDPVPLCPVKIPNSTDLKFVAEMAGISQPDLKRYNPELLKWCTPPCKEGYLVKIPATQKEFFAQNFSKNKEKFLSAPAFHKHQIRRGETLYAIARLYNTKVVHIQKMNGIRNPRLIHPGQILLIPAPPLTSS